MKYTHIADHSFPPVINKNSEILILGSFPSVASRADGFFYMYKQNRFWKLLSKIYEDNFETESIDQKIKFLHKYNIALYDVIESCDIIGSKDSSIENVVPADISSLIKNTKIKSIYVNGKKAFELFKQYNVSLLNTVKYLPSTSSANAAYSIEKLYEHWKTIKDLT